MLDEAYLFHFTRRDHRHNFAPHFLGVHLSPAPGAAEPSTSASAWAAVPLAAQLAVVSAVGVVFCRNVAAACFLQTLCFVAFNSVCTVQYFVWYSVLAPLALPMERLGELAPHAAAWLASVVRAVVTIPRRGPDLTCASRGRLAQAFWLGSAYTLEMLGWQSFMLVRLARMGRARACRCRRQL